MEFCLMDVIRYYIKNKYIILVIMLLFIFGGIIYTNKYMEYEYESSTDILVGSCINNCIGVSYDDLELANGLINGYIELIKSRQLIELVIDELKIDINYRELRDFITVNHEEDSYFINISVKTNDSEFSALIANELVNKLSIQASLIYKVDNIYVVNKAMVNNNPVHTDSYYYVLFTIVGFMFSSVIVLVLFCFDQRIINNYSKKIGDIPILGMIKFKFLRNKNDMNRIDYYNQFLEIRNRLKLLKNTARSFIVSSVDKTDTSFSVLNMARTLSKTGSRVLVLDINLDVNLTRFFGYEERKGILDYLNGRLKLENIIYRVLDDKVDFMPIGLSDKIDLLGVDKFNNLLNLLEDKYDYILIDVGNIDRNVNAKAVLVNKLDIILVCTENLTRMNYIYNFLDYIKMGNSMIDGIIIYNR